MKAGQRSRAERSTKRQCKQLITSCLLCQWTYIWCCKRQPYMKFVKIDSVNPSWLEANRSKKIAGRKKEKRENVKCIPKFSLYYFWVMTVTMAGNGYVNFHWCHATDLVFLLTQFGSSCYTCKGSGLLTPFTFILTISEEILTPRPPSLSDSPVSRTHHRICCFNAGQSGSGWAINVKVEKGKEEQY